jgi:hypothetical protein
MCGEESKLCVVEIEVEDLIQGSCFLGSLV